MTSSFEIYTEPLTIDNGLNEPKTLSKSCSYPKNHADPGKENINMTNRPVSGKDCTGYSNSKDEATKAFGKLSNSQNTQPLEPVLKSHPIITSNKQMENPGSVTRSQTQILEQIFPTPQKQPQNTRTATKNSDQCPHQNTVTYRCKYCKDCGIFLPKGNSKVMRESLFKQRLQTNPDRILSIMLNSQSKNRHYNPKAGFIKGRKILVDWICELGEDLKYSSDTIHVAVSYLETVLSQLEIPKNRLQLTSLICIYIAGKFSESDQRAVKLKDIYEFGRGIYPMELLEKTELMILEVLDWKLRSVTPPQFLELFLAKGVVFSTDSSLIRAIDGKLLRYIRKYAEFFADLALQEYSFNRFDSHTVACACIAASRKFVGLRPSWNDQLTELTTATWEQISTCFSEILQVYQNTFPESAEKNKKQLDAAHPEIASLSSESKSDLSDKKMNIEYEALLQQSHSQMNIESESTVDNSVYLAETPYKLPTNDSHSYGNMVSQMSSCKQEMPAEVMAQNELAQSKKQLKNLQISKEYPTQRINLPDTNRMTKSAGKFEYSKASNLMAIEGQASNSFSNESLDNRNCNIRRNLLF